MNSIRMSLKLLGDLRYDIHFRELLQGSSIAFFFKLFGSGATFLFSLMIARSLGAFEVGLFFLALSVTEIFAICGRLGMAQSIIAFVSKYSIREEWYAVKGSFVKSILLLSIASLMAGTLMFFLSPLLAIEVFRAPELIHLIRIMSLSVPAVALLNLYGNALKGLRLMRESQLIISMSLQLLLLLFMIPVLIFPGINFVAFAYGAAAWGAAAWGFYLWRLRTPHLKKVKGAFSFSMLLSSAIPLLWANLLTIVNSRAGTFILGIMATPYDVGVYNISFRIAMLTNFVLLSVTAICTPKFAALHASSDREGLARVARQSTFLMIIATLPILSVIIIFPDSILSFFGNDFSGSSKALIALTLGQCVNVASGPVGMLLAMTGNERHLRNIYLLSTPINFLLQFAFIPIWGVNGAAWATSISIIGYNIFATYLVKKKLMISIFPIGSSVINC